MNINYQDIITLNDDSEYIVVSKVKYNNNDYIYLVDIHDNKNIKIAEIEKECISILTEKETELISKLIPLFYNYSKKDIFIDVN